MNADDGELASAVILGLSPTGLYAVRELGRAGVPVLGVSAQDQAGGWSRYLTLGSLVEADEVVRLERLLAAFAPGGPRPVLIPASDQDIDFVTRHAAALSQRFVFQPSYVDGVGEALMTKASFYDLCRRHGVAIPSSWDAVRDDVARLAGDIAFPCLIKPSRIHAVKQAMAGRKVWVATSAAEYRQVAAALPEGDTTWLVQEIVAGPESAITLYAAHFDASGTPRQAATCRKLRQYPPGFGSASLVESAPEPETREISEALLAAVGYRGIAATEFKRDPRDGRLKIIEVNPRPSLWFEVTAAAGKRVTLAAHRELSGLAPLPETAQRDGVEWRYGGKDLYSRLFYAVARGFPLPPPDLRGRARPVRRVSAVFASDDPGPVLGEGVNFARKFVRRALTSGKPKGMN